MSMSASQLVEHLLQASNRVLDDVSESQSQRKQRATSCTDQHSTTNQAGLRPGLDIKTSARPGQTRPEQRCTANHDWVLFQKESKEKKTEGTHKRAASEPMGTHP